MPEISPTHREWLDRMSAAEDEAALTSVGIHIAQDPQASALSGDVHRTVLAPPVADYLFVNLSSGVGPHETNHPSNSG